MTEKGPNFQQTLTRSCQLKGDALIIYSKLPRYGLCSHGAGARRPAAIKVQMSIAAVGADNKPVPAAFMIGRAQRPRRSRSCATCATSRRQAGGRRIRNRPQARQAFVVNLLSHWDIRDFKKPIEEYTGPGLLVEWLKIEGPIDPWPPPSYERLFAGCR